MICPKCKQEQYCGCEICKEIFPHPVTYIWVNPNAIACGHCGYTKSVDWWAQYEIKCFKEQGLWSTSKDTERK